MVSKKCTLIAFVAIQVALAAHAQAQSSGNTKVTAEALFEDGRRLLAAGKYAEACPKFADSERLDPSTATLLNLANCWEKCGRTATAWATYREAQSMAFATGRKDYLATAERHANALAPKLARITIQVPQPVEGIQIERDGVVVDRAEWGVALPVDTGPHAIAATAPGHKAWASKIDVAQDGTTLTVTVPALDPLPVEPSPQPSTAPPASTAAPTRPTFLSPETAGLSKESRAGGSTQRIIAAVVGGLGVVGLLISTGYAVDAKNKDNESNSNGCSGTRCNKSSGLNDRNDALWAGNAATVAFGLGAAAIAAGAILWLSAPRGASDASGRVALTIVPTFGGGVLRATW